MNLSSSSQAINFLYKWVIKNFSSRTENITSSEFSPLEDMGNTWVIKLDQLKEGGFVSVALKSTSASSDITASFSILLKSIEERDNIIAHEASSQKLTFSKDSKSWGWDNITRRDEIIDKIREHDDTLLVICELELEPIQHDRVKVSCQNSLLSNLERLVNNPEHCDVTLESSDGGIIRAHKIILAAVSPMFADMFRNNALESGDTNRVLIPDVDRDTLLRLMTFVYSSKVHEVDGMSYTEKVNLLVAAYKYGISSLEALLEEYLILIISRSNAVDLLITSHLCKRPKLKGFVIKFICTQEDDYILLSHGWNSMASNYPELLNECFKNMFLLHSKYDRVTE